MSLTNESRPDSRQTARADRTRIDREVAYQALSNRRRRFTVHYLIQRWEPISLRTLSEQIAAWENGVSRAQVTSKQRKRTYTALHQAHLPKLDKMGIIEYDTHEMVAHPTEKLGTLRIYMDVVPEDEIPWSVFYTGIAISFGAGSALGWLGLPPFAAVSGDVWAILTAVIIAAIGAVNIYRNRQNRLGMEGPPPEVAHIESS